MKKNLYRVNVSLTVSTISLLVKAVYCHIYIILMFFYSSLIIKNIGCTNNIVEIVLKYPAYNSVLIGM